MKVDIKTVRRILAICIIVVTVILISSIIIRNMNSNTDEIISIDKMIGKTVKTNYVKIKDKNGDIFYLPKGFKISENAEEQNVNNGLVIIDDTGDKQTKGSEFVWIPVDNSSNEVFEEKFTNNIGNKYKTLDFNMLKENTETEEYIQMKNSVYNYGGFYIARYEAGISEKMQEELQKNNLIEKESIIEDTTQEFANGKYKPVSKHDTIVWNFVQWGGTFKEKASDGFSGDDSSNGVVKVAKYMYEKNSKTHVNSGLCFGSQWESIMNFIDENYSTNTCSEDSVVIDSSQSGNYYNQIQKTSSNVIYSQKNIYDLSGNVWEWTMEGFGELYRVTRGGSYNSKGDVYSMSASKKNYPNDYSKDIGFRVALWIK